MKKKRKRSKRKRKAQTEKKEEEANIWEEKRKEIIRKHSDELKTIKQRRERSS